MKKVILFIFLALGITAFSADYSKGRATLLRLVKISSSEYGFWITYDPLKDGAGRDEPLKATETKDEIGVAVKKGNSYYYEGESYGESCKIEITESSKKVTVKTNNICAGLNKYDGVYNYSGQTSKTDIETIKSAAEYED